MSLKRIRRLLFLQGCTCTMLACLAVAIIHAHHGFQSTVKEKIGTARSVPIDHVRMIIGEANTAVYVGISFLAFGLLSAGICMFYLYKKARHKDLTTEVVEQCAGDRYATDDRDRH
jgi:hypothetical protein